MQTMFLPKGVLDHIDKFVRRFLWRDTETQKHVHLLSWETVTKRYGGLGIRDALSSNQAFLMNQAWRIWRNENSLLDKFLRHRHYHNSNFLLTSSSHGSHAWKALLGGRNLMKKGLCWVVQSGHSINFWLDHWLPIGPIRGLVHGPFLAHEYDFKVARFVVDNQRWDFTPLSMVLPNTVIQHILAQPLPLNVTHIPSNIQT